jgi:hypothetical protein
MADLSVATVAGEYIAMLTWANVPLTPATDQMQCPGVVATWFTETVGLPVAVLICLVERSEHGLAATDVFHATTASDGAADADATALGDATDDAAADGDATGDGASDGEATAEAVADGTPDAAADAAAVAFGEGDCDGDGDGVVDDEHPTTRKDTASTHPARIRRLVIVAPHARRPQPAARRRL